MRNLDEIEMENEALRERLSRLSEASLRINESLDFDQVLQGVLDSACSLTSARYGVMILLDDQGLVLDFLSSGLTAEESGRLWEMPEGLRIFQALTGISEPMRVTDLAEYIRALGFSDFNIPLPVGVFSFLATPMFHRGARVGHVFVGYKKDGRDEFTMADQETLVMFASQAALVIANARRHREEQRARADLETLIDTSPVGVVVLDAETGAPVSFNQEAARIVDGLREEGQTAKDLLDVVACRRSDGREVSLREMPLAEALRAGETVRAEEIVLRIPDGRSVAALLNATPIYSEDGHLASFVVTLQDLTPLEEQERLRAEFLAMVSHKLRTPLSSIKGSAATLLGSASSLDPSEMDLFFRIIDLQADRMSELITDLRDNARIEAGTLSVTPVPSEPASLIDQARNTFLSSGGRDNVLLDLEPDLPRVMADRRRIVQVLGNLLSNASRHSPQFTAIRVTAAVGKVHVAFSIADDGSGLAAEAIPQLFSKFSRVSGDDSASGTVGSGLGLAICRGIVEAHGGRIWAESDGPGLGSRFTFTLPAVEDSNSVAPAAPRGAGGQRHSGRNRPRVLAVDDDPQTLRYLRAALEDEGFSATVTGDPQQVGTLLLEARPHLVLLDLVLPGTDGIKLLESVPGLADVPVIFLSAYGRDQTVAQALEAGAVDYIVKPLSPTELAARIRTALRRQTSPDSIEPSEPYKSSGLTIDYASRTVSLDGRTLQLTELEYRLLFELSVNAGSVVTHDHLLRSVWGQGHAGHSGPVRTVVKNLRRKLGDNGTAPRSLLSEPRIGYRMPSGGGPED